MYRRNPAVSGTFYPSSRSALTLMVQGYLEERHSSCAIGIVSPHAGYVYSGSVAGAVYSEADIPPVVLLLGPNHRLSPHKNYGMALIAPSGSFATPIGDVEVDEGLARQLLADGETVVADIDSHGPEHSLEVQLPFLQMRRPDVRIVPLLMNFGWSEGHKRLHQMCGALGRVISRCVKEYQEEVLIVASSDMNHMESRQVTGVKDGIALGRIKEYDVAGFLEATEREHITVCGRVAIAVMMEAAKGLGATEVEVIRYDDSGDVTGDLEEVVGYAGIVFRRASE